LKIVVCIKQISDPEYFPQITLDPETGSIQRDKVPAILNPLDENALEEGLRIKEKFSGTLTVVTMGPPGAREVLDWALALGADEAVLLSDRAFAGADTLATAYTLAFSLPHIRAMPRFPIIENSSWIYLSRTNGSISIIPNFLFI
jgi:electron transfer flavoprotein beta subunit